MAEETQPDITTLTVQLLSAFLSNNSLAADALPDLIKSTRAALAEAPVAVAEPTAEAHVAAVSVRKSLASPDHIISMLDGKPYKTLKRHLATNGLTPDEYRERYKLPKSYPIVAPSYSEQRRAVAAKLGLGRRPVASTEAAAIETAAPLEAAPAVAPKVAKAPPEKPSPARTAKSSPKQKASNAAAKPAATSEAVVEAVTAPATPTRKGGRKRLSIAAPKAQDGTAATVTTAVGEGTAPTEIAPAPVKAASVAKPKATAKVATKTDGAEPKAAIKAKAPAKPKPSTKPKASKPKAKAAAKPATGDAPASEFAKID